MQLQIVTCFLLSVIEFLKLYMFFSPPNMVTLQYLDNHVFLLVSKQINAILTNQNRDN